MIWDMLRSSHFHNRYKYDKSDFFYSILFHYFIILISEAAVLRKKVFWKYATNLQGNTHVEMWFQ